MRNKTKKFAILSLVAAMGLTGGFAVAEAMSTVPADMMVTAEEVQATTVATIAGTEYSSFAEALAAASAMTGEVTMDIYGKVTLNAPLSGGYSKIAFVGKTETAEIYMDVQGYLTATGKAVTFTDLKLSKVAGGYVANAGFMNLAFGLYDVNSITYTNCTFLNGAYASTQNVTFLAVSLPFCSSLTPFFQLVNEELAMETFNVPVVAGA